MFDTHATLYTSFAQFTTEALEGVGAIPLQPSLLEQAHMQEVIRVLLNAD